MSSYEKFLNEVKEANVNFNINTENTHVLLSGEVLFHTPLLSLTILCISASVKKPFASIEVSNWTGSILSQTFWGPKAANRKLEWSLTLRKRCADAMVFLETMELITVEGDNRLIKLSDKGKEFCRKGLKREDEFGQLVRGIRRATLDTEIKGFTLL